MSIDLKLFTLKMIPEVEIIKETKISKIIRNRSLSPQRRRQQFGQSMTEYMVVTVFCVIAICVAIMASTPLEDGGDFDWADSDDSQMSLLDGVNTHEQNFKNQMMLP